jgi:glucose-1-phosphate cytidylyltransferase
MKTLILCGGKGTRAYPQTVELPKPLLEVAGRPVLGHLMEIYAAQGFTEFVLAAGYKSELVWKFAQGLPKEWTVDVVDTGEDTNTGGRVAACRDRLGQQFFVTYADGLGNVDLNRLVDFHNAHPGSATVTTVPLPSQYGTFHVGDGGRVEGFQEKPRLADYLINAGFFVMDDRAFAFWAGEDLEREVLPALGEAGELYAYRHDGFWKSMDTYKDAIDLTNLCADGPAPWMVPVVAAADPAAT